jgi:hypothetical protein
MNKKTIYEYLYSTENGDIAARSRLCQLFYDNQDLCKTMPDDFWERTDRIAEAGEDYANFIMHCRYFEDTSQSSLSYHYIRKAIRHKDIPLAILRLGITYAYGIGAIENHALANYFYEMADTMGCREAKVFIDLEYESGERDIVHDVIKAINDSDIHDPSKMAELKKRVERERTKKNYGSLSRLRQHLPIFYPDYNQEKAYSDILNDNDTIDADICYSLSTSDNQSEININRFDCMLSQLFSPIIHNEDLFQNIIKSENGDIMGGDEKELVQCIANLASSYYIICKKHKKDEKEISHLDSTDLLPFFSTSLLALLRKQAFRCLLSIKDVDPFISKYLRYLDDDEHLLNICEIIKDQDVQLFLISFIELNIGINSLMTTYQSLLLSHRNHQRNKLANYLNDFVKRLTDAGIEHQLPVFTSENLPLIQLSSNIIGI